MFRVTFKRLILQQEALSLWKLSRDWTSTLHGSDNVCALGRLV